MVRRHSSSLLRLDIHQEPTCAAVPTGAQSDFGLMTCFTAQAGHQFWGNIVTDKQPPRKRRGRGEFVGF
ncbi:hypothetical protein WJX77_006060 [Trebouxia sp. C0004]